ncbi:MAG: DUF3524 domain-containing protein, partial [Planctomycetales bacterium]|nr:DUF3524 domain-containing protein [Planctomycetales bacterium]
GPDHRDRNWDVVFCTDMLNLAEFRGLCRSDVEGLPAIVYFHENQLTYPNREARERDLHFAFTNLTTCLAADAVWFNSRFHREAFLTGMANWMRNMPDHQLLDASDKIRAKSSIHWPGIEMPSRRMARRAGPLRILWSSRWEHDKDPETFFNAIQLLRMQHEPFRLAVLGESFGNVPACFATARDQFSEYIDHWGYTKSREQYLEVLLDADVVVSTARHEFFGIGVVEAVAAGCFPLVPRCLAYPEVLGDHDDFFHDGTPRGIVARLKLLSQRAGDAASCWPQESDGRSIASQYAWPIAATRMDVALEQILGDSLQGY